jgi:hypothetical protein
VSDSELTLDLPGKRRAPFTAVCQWLTPPASFVAPPIIDDERALGELVVLWRDSFRPADPVQLIIPLFRLQGTPDDAVAAIVAVADVVGVDLGSVADVVISAVPGDRLEDVAGVAGGRATWIALRGPAPASSGWSSVPPRPESLHGVRSSSPPFASLAAEASHNTSFDVDGAA